jgi:hypothetical protein
MNIRNWRSESTIWITMHPDWHECISTSTPIFVALTHPHRIYQFASFWRNIYEHLFYQEINLFRNKVRGSDLRTYRQGKWTRQQKQDIWSAERKFWCTSMVRARCIVSRRGVSKCNHRSVINLQSKIMIESLINLKIYTYKNGSGGHCIMNQWNGEHDPQVCLPIKYYASSILVDIPLSEKEETYISNESLGSQVLDDWSNVHDLESDFRDERVESLVSLREGCAEEESKLLRPLQLHVGGFRLKGADREPRQPYQPIKWIMYLLDMAKLPSSGIMKARFSPPEFRTINFSVIQKYSYRRDK